MIIEAVQFAEKAHRGEFREPEGSGVPYIVHPLAVARLCEECGFGVRGYVIVAALLHDVVESALDAEFARNPTAWPWGAVAEPLFWKIKDQFGSGVSDLVWSLTDKPASKAERRRQQMTKKYEYDAAVVKIADKTCNVRDLARTMHRPIADIEVYLARARVVVASSCDLEHKNDALKEAWGRAEEELEAKIAEARAGSA